MSQRAKPMCRVKKNATGQLEVASVVYQVTSMTTTSGQTLFPAANRNNFCYIVVDSERKVCQCLYHAYSSFW
jgi:hypothetical protein